MKQKHTSGSVVKIRIDDKHHTYGRLLEKPYVAIYDCKVENDLEDLAEIVNSPILFILGVYDDVVKKARWQIVGMVSMEESPVEVPVQFLQDSYPPYSCFLIDVLGNMTPATVDQCRGLEPSAVWEAEHVEDRLRDHYQNVTNIWLDSMKLRES